MKKNLTARFTAEVIRLDTGARHHLLPVPASIAAAFKAAKVRRLIGTINRHPINRALQNHADGGSFLLLGQPLLGELGLKRGSIAKVELKPDPKPDTLELPEEFATALAQDEAARARWETFTPGRKRSLLYYISSAKQEATRIKRSVELTQKIRTHTLYGDKLKLKRP
jgi:hypothetical protein